LTTAPRLQTDVIVELSQRMSLTGIAGRRHPLAAAEEFPRLHAECGTARRQTLMRVHRVVASLEG
jgi:hypothetical protein